MALVGSLKAEDKYNAFSENMDGVYFKIEGVFVDTEREKVRIAVRGYMSEFARQNQGNGIFKRVFYAELGFFGGVKCTAKSLTKKAYEFIKRLPEFDGCEDSLEKYTGDVLVTKERVEKDQADLETLIDSLKK
jgi:hypothetical protein